MPTPKATLELPPPGSFHSGSGVISGLACDADQIHSVLDDTSMFQAAFGPGRALADGIEFGSATVTITSFGVEVPMGDSGRFQARD